jgi:hypothetical protein
MSELPKRMLGRTGLQVTTLGYGAMELRGAPRGPAVSDEAAEKVLNAVLDAGINFIDTSIDYGRSEELIGRFLAHRRSEYFLASKCGCVPGMPGGSDHVHTPENIRTGVEQSLRKMKTDYLDLVQFHRSLTRDEFVKDGALDTVLELKREGKGASSVSPPPCPISSSRLRWGCSPHSRSPIRRSSASTKKPSRGQGRPARESSSAAEPHAARLPIGGADLPDVAGKHAARSLASGASGRAARRHEPHGVHFALHALQPGSGHDNRRNKGRWAPARQYRRRPEGPASRERRSGGEAAACGSRFSSGPKRLSKSVQRKRKGSCRPGSAETLGD